MLIVPSSPMEFSESGERKSESEGGGNMRNLESAIIYILYNIDGLYTSHVGPILYNKLI